VPAVPDSDRARCWCVIPAAGRGTRMGAALPKQYLDLAGQPLLLHTLQRLARHPRIAGLLVVLAADDARWPGITQLADKPVLTATGGAERADSVLAGLRALPDTVLAQECVLVHDAARPLLRAEDLERLVQAGLTHPHGRFSPRRCATRSSVPMPPVASRPRSRAPACGMH